MPGGHRSESKDEEPGLPDLVGDSPAMRQVFDQIRLVAPTRSTVLITGESGTGKELAVRAIHRLSPRRDGPLVALNCAAIPRELAESELFGHAKGAFTGATDRRLGKFAAADRGTLLIDEIGEMALPVQAKLLRTLETRAINPVGSNDEQPVDVRVVAATHRDLRGMVETGTFREDLYYRLHVVHIHLPPLRQRRDDIPLLVSGFLDEFAREHGRDVREVTPAAMDALRAYHWPGNVRELRNVLEGAVVLSRTGVIDLSDLALDECGIEVVETAPQFCPGVTLAGMEREAIQRCLIHTGGSRRRSAELLGISTRTLLRKIREYRLEDPRQVAHAGV
jgi:two-component system nitrogen regulation response regulator GlnG